MSESRALPFLGKFPTHDDRLVYWEDPQSLTWLARTIANKPFSRLTRFYEAQADKFMCGPAAVAMILNALDVKLGCRPIDAEHETFARRYCHGLPVDYSASFQRFTQRNIFHALNSNHKTIESVYGAPNAAGRSSFGLNLHEIATLLEAHGVQARVHEVDEGARDLHMDNIGHALSSENLFVIANFDRAVWGLEGAGHVSPLAAYDFISRKALVLDVNMTARWLWIDINLLIQSMATWDSAGQKRGYLIASK